MLSLTRTALIALAVFAPQVALASSDDAWAQFANDVQKKCRLAGLQTFRKPLVAVDPTGTENYGVAIVYGRTRETKERAAVICVVNKKSGKVELGSELGASIIRVARPKPEGEDDTQAKPQSDQQGATTKGGDAGGQDDDTQQ